LAARRHQSAFGGPWVYFLSFSVRNIPSLYEIPTGLHQESIFRAHEGVSRWCLPSNESGKFFIHYYTPFKSTFLISIENRPTLSQQWYYTTCECSPPNLFIALSSPGPYLYMFDVQDASTSGSCECRRRYSRIFSGLEVPTGKWASIYR
jgi:hypothetical protein